MKHLLVFLSILFYSELSAQQREDAALEQSLVGKTKFYDIKQTVNNFYDQKLNALTRADSFARKSILRKAKFWNRYFYEAESRLNSNGEVENAAKKTIEYLSTPSAVNSLTTAYGAWSHIGPNNVSSGIGR